jgi:hypothetical protein
VGSRTRTIVLSAVAVLALNAVAVASASAIEWFVGGVKLTSLAPSEKAISEASTVTVPLILKSAGLTVECKVLKFKKSFISGTVTNSEENLEFSTCEVTSAPKTCKVVQPIKTTKIKSTLETGVFVKLSPEVGELFAEMKIQNQTGKLCGVATEEDLVKGFARGEVSEAGTELKEHQIKFTEASGSKLTLAGLEAKLTGTSGLTLTSGEFWSAK